MTGLVYIASPYAGDVEANPVSYTHLDVYKRQEYARLNLIAAGVRDAVQEAILSTVNDNYDDCLLYTSRCV